MTNARDAYVRGTDGVTEQFNPMTRAAAQVAKWQANVSSATARARWLAGLARVTLQAWKDACRNKGANNLARGAEQARAKMLAAFTRVFPWIQTARGVVEGMPSGSFEERVARMNAYARSMHEQAAAGNANRMPGG